MGVRRGRKAISVVFVASIASGGLVLVANQPTEAASPPTLTIPGRVYPEPGQALAFTGTDPVSDDNRAIVVDGLVDGPLGCAPDAGNHYDVDDCPGVDISMNTTKAGLLRVDGNSVVDDNGSDVIWNQDNSVVVTATDPQGLDSQLFTFRGPAAGIANILATLQLVPCTNQQGTLKDPAPVDPAESIYEVNCGDFAGDPALEPAYEERESSDGQLPHLHVLAIQGDASATASGDVYIKFEGSNDGPTLSATTSTIDAAAGATTAIADVLDVDDTDMCSNSLCPGDGYDPDPDNTRQEGDDAMLLVVWLAENNCGTFDPRGDSFFPDQGGASSPSLEDVVKGWTGLDLNDSNQAIAADAIWTAVETTLSPDAAGIDLSGQGAGNVTAWAGIGGIDDVKYTLGGIDYNAPGDDTTCHLDVAVSDLGNNGAPLSYVGSPFGPETPYVGEPGGNDVPYEVPNALATSTSLTLNVKDGHPAVTIDQLLPGPLGSPAGPNKPSSFTITFGDPIDPASFDTSDLSLTTSNAAVPGLGLLVPITPGVKYSVPVTATGGDTTLKLEFTGSACAVGHFSGSCESGFDTEAATYSDNEIDWDQTGPEVTIDKKTDPPAQADPTSGTSVVFTVKFSDTVSTAPIGFDASDVDLSASTTGAGTHVSDVTQPSLIDLKTYEVTVTGMTTPGDVIATVKPNAIVDTALNGSQASTSTDNSVQFVNEPVASIDSPSILEGDSGTTQLIFTVSLDQPAVGGETVTVDTSDGVVNGATAGSDYVALTNHDVVFAAGETGQLVSVTINGDGNPEANEVFDITLSNPQGLTIGNGAGVGTITNDDTGPAASISPSFVKEGDAGTTPMTFLVTLDTPAAGGESVVVTPTPVSTSLDDLTSYAPKLVTFGAGDTVKLVTFDVVGDTNPEPDEHFTVTLGSAVGVAIQQGTGDAEIFNDDVEVSIDAATSIVEGAAGSLTVHISPAVHPQFFLTLMSTDGSAVSLVPAADYEPTQSPVSIAADATTFVVPLGTIEDNDVEGSETFSVTAGPPAAQAPDFTVRVDPAADTGVVTITDNDQPSVVSIADASVIEGGATNQTIVSMTNPTGHFCQVTATSTNGSASAPGDFTAVNYGLQLTEANPSQPVPIDVVDDGTPEPPKAFTIALALMPGPNCVLGDASANILLADDDLVDNVKPDVTITKAALQGDPTVVSPVVFDVAFSEPVSGFDASDVVLGTPPTGATLTPTITGGPQNYQVSVDVAGATATGTVQVSINADAATDGSGNTSNASNQATVTFLVDAIPPTVSIAAKSGQPNPTKASPVMFTVTFSEDVTGFDVGTDVSLSGSANPTTAVITPVTASVYDVAVSGMSGPGAVIATVGGSKATDLAGNANAAAPSPAQVVYDNVAPTVTINQTGVVDPTSSPSIDFTVVFSESVTGFTSSGVILSGTAGATTANVTGSGATYTVSVSGMTQSGTVIASVASSAAQDAAGNLNAASTSSDNTVTFNKPVDNVPPTVTVDQAAGQTDPTTGPQVKFTAVFSEAVGGFTGSDVVVSGTAGATAATVTDTGDHIHFDVVVANMLHSGTVIVTIPAAAAQDAALNDNLASTSTDNTVTFNEAVINVSTPGGTVTVTVTQGGVLNSAGTQALQVPPPNGVTFPFGQLSFTATGPAGGLVTFQLQLPSAVNDYYKLVSNAWQQFTFDGETGAVISNGGTTITVTIKDNGRGDSDPTAGVMTDPAAPAVVAQVPPTTPTTTAPTTTAPTTSPTTAPGALPPTGSSSTNNLIVLASLLVGIGCLLAGARRRQSKSAKA